MIPLGLDRRMTFLGLREPLLIGRTSLALWAVLGAGTLAYFITAQVGLYFATAFKAVSPVWPASGLAVALLLHFGLRMWPAVALGAFAANALAVAPGAALIIAGGNTLEAVAGAIILRRMIVRPGAHAGLNRDRVARDLGTNRPAFGSAPAPGLACLPTRRPRICRAI
jgi:hypothetical protein